MNDVVKFLIVECSLLAVGLVIISVFLIYNFRKQAFPKRSRTESLEGKCIILPSNEAQIAEFERRVEKLFSSDAENDKTTEDSSIIDEMNNVAKRGRLYFSLMYEANSDVLTIKLIRGENLPILSQDSSKAYVNVQLICCNAEGNSSGVVKKSTSYQRTHKFYLPPNEFLSHIIHFEVSRFDRYSRKYDVAHVVVSLLELQAEIVGLNREKIFAKDIVRNWSMQSRKRRRSSGATRVNSSPAVYRMRRDIKVRCGKPRMLWKKLSLAVHAGLFKDACLNANDSLQWDPFIIVQRYKFCGDDTSEHNEQEDSSTYSVETHGSASVDERGTSRDENSPLFTEPFQNCSATDTQFDGSNSEAENGHLLRPRTSSHEEFYRLVHSPLLERRLKPITSWSIPETFPFSSPLRQTQSRTHVFQSVPIAYERHDRLHKLTSLSANYREKLLRKSRRRARSCRGRLSGRVFLHESLYLGKETHRNSEQSTENSKSHKRQRRATHS